jgi:folate-binding protein YgfZ
MMTTSTTLAEQYSALRDGRSFVELANWSSVTLTGADRQKFLNSFCTNDVAKLTPGNSCEAFITNVKGRIVGHGLIDCRNDELVFIGTPDQAPKLVEHLDRYIIREDVQLRDTTSERAYLYAPKLPPMPAARGIGCSDTLAIFEIATKDVAQVRQSLHEQNYLPCDMLAFESMRIEDGVPFYGVDFDEQNFPQEVNRDREAISFAKGCYLGQETVARIDALGHVNQKLVGVRFLGEHVPAIGAELTKDGAKVGLVKSAAFSPRLNAPLALAMVRREANSPGTRLESQVGECEVISLPLTSENA